MSSNCFAILLGGTLRIDDRVRTLVAGARVIAADGGIRHAAPLGLLPELWVGDFDSSYDIDAADWLHVPRKQFPVAKKATDGEIAVEEAIAQGADRIIMVGALEGERSDHAGLHLLYSLVLAERGIATVLTSGEEEAVPVVPGQLEMQLPDGALFSILPYSDLKMLTIEGARYPLKDVDIDFGSSRTLSNVATGNISIGLKSGRAVLIARPNDFTGY